MSSNFVLLVIVVMDSSSIFLCICLMLLKWQVRGQENSLLTSLTTVETQYLTFDMAQYGPDGGVFSSPNFPNYYPQDTILFYQFIAASDYRVQVEIDFFQVRGVTPQCTHDYLDVFINVTNFDFTHNILNDQLLHRYCGRNKPPLLVSFTNLLLLGFFTEDTQTERGFNGTFRFISAQPYRNNLQHEPCDYIFNSSISKRGELFSSTYPGTYLSWQFCNYSFIGLPGERIHIRFRDFILYKTPNTQHCAVDLIKLYDNTLDPPELRRFLSSFRHINNNDQQFLSEQQTDQNHITDLCGTYTLPLDVYSTSNYLLLYFISTHYAELTDDEQIQINDISPLFWRKGFYAEYEFLSSLTTIDFISKSKSNQYLSGTECDQTIKSYGQGNGKIQSPNWPQPYKPQTLCTTYLLGLDDRYTLENVEIEFDQFDIDCHLASLVIYNASRIYDHRVRLRPPSSHSTSSTSMTTSKSSLFSNYYRQELDFKANLSFCGHFKPEGRFVSKNALLKLSFIPNDRLGKNVLPSLINGGKFQAKYKFVKSYHQVSADEYDGTNSNNCNFSYYQSRTSFGKFEPPRSSENDYFSNSNCTFNFYPLNENSRLLIWYDYFNIVDNDHNKCLSDNLTYSYNLYISSQRYLHPFPYCGYRNFPSPYLTIRATKQFHIHFRSNDDSDAGLGFDGRYQFLNQSSSFFSSICRSPFDPVIHINETNEPSGNLSSNGYPENIICEWSYVTTHGFQFNLELNMLEIEGSKTKDPPQGCQTSVLRIYSEGRIDELCGQQESVYYFLTDSNWFTIQFISLNRQTKELLRGFQLLWTIVQIKSNPNDHQCLSPQEYFHCKKTLNSTSTNSFCIHRSLLCDGHVHCQPASNEDELSSNCFLTIPTRSRFLLPISPSSSSSFVRQHLILIITICILCITMICVAIVLILLLIKMKRRQQDDISTPIDFNKQEKRIQRRRQKQQDNLSLRKKSIQTYLDDDGNNQDLIGINMMEQAVTSV